MRPFNKILSLLTALFCTSSFLQSERPISPFLLGFNNSYFNDLDAIWKAAQIPKHLKNLNVGILRYPGGEETSRYDWKYPGVTGYIDVWNKGMYTQQWQTTWVSKEDWNQNQSYMDVDEYFAHCKQIKAEPLLGVNMTSGIINGREKECLENAKDLLKHCKNQGYPLVYVYLDNEPWHKHKSNYYHFKGNSYAENVVKYATALRQIFPDIKIVVNPFDGNQFNLEPQLKKFLKIAGDSVDVMDAHWYWSFGSATFQGWKNSLPLKNSAKWKPYDQAITYTQFIKNAKSIFSKAGYPDMQLAALEWNISPPVDESSKGQIALMQAEMFMQFIEGDLDMACVWPMFWQVNPPDGINKNIGKTSGNGDKRSIFNHVAPYDLNPSYHMFQLFADLKSAQFIEAQFLSQGIYVIMIREIHTKNRISYVLNKSNEDHEYEFSAGEVLGSDHFETKRFKVDGILTETVKAKLKPSQSKLLVPSDTLTKIVFLK